MSPKEPDFDWVTARWECSLQNEFEKLRKGAEENVKARKYLMLSDSPVEFSFDQSPENQFEVSRSPTRGFAGKKHDVIFCLRHDHICIQDHFRNKTLVLTVTLNNDGECRLQIKGQEGEFLGWQVLRTALEGILFERLRRRP